ncbi:thiosulfate/3-mercaptopyruvate sulfurtransferase [Paenibacillus sp. DS2015]|uniref:sulfurtransferase n=1 Tax=Paenibacillus sp. DS2015 TaxID=3373917 RepID=UPI003D1E2A07
MTSIISKQWLLARMYEPDLVIIDCRFIMGQPEAGRSAYEEEHIPGAVYLDLEKDLSAPVTEHGGRHPLPDPDHLVKRLQQLGISNDTRIIAYDDQGGAMASRLWWLMRYLGHSEVYIMNEGFSDWKNSSYPVTTDQPIRVPQSYVANLNADMLVDVEGVRQASLQRSSILIDSREPARYQGLEETIDAVAGHIPGAINKFWKELKDEQGHWKKPALLDQHFDDLPRDQEIIVYCGSGVTACPNVLGLYEAGYTQVKLYGGSWSDWISYERNEIATGEE